MLSDGQALQVTSAGEEKPKRESQKLRDAKKAEKVAKFQTKLQKMKEHQATAKANTNKSKEDKKREVIKYDCIVEEGAEKDLGDPMPGSYSADYVEACWYAWWKRSGFFKPEINARQATTKANSSSHIHCL
ncbi:valine--tRNA ligase-like [Brevipalpus obovatus]|uniref:valine--tRNA ligase-like n=1 Tax=Brevipalpus obovatus TaxID=246614 RepID=UPI003D9DE500